MSLQEDSSKESTKELYMQTECTKMLDKAYRFFHDGHVQDLKCHPLCVVWVLYVARVLASMKKIFYHVTILHGSQLIRLRWYIVPVLQGYLGACNCNIILLER